MQPSPRVSRYSLDWRFLLPLADVQNVGLLLENDLDFRDTLARVGIQPSQQLSRSELEQRASYQRQSLVLPFGLPKGWVSAQYQDQVAFYSALHRLLAADGHLLVGFNNTWNLDAAARREYHASTPGRVTVQLRQAGFHSIEVFGALRNLAIPEFIFHLEPRTIEFALQTRFRRKPAFLRTLRLAAGTVGLARLSNFLPCYFAVAVA